MQYAEALREVKKAEAEVREMKADAQRQASQVLRDAERQANELIEKARAEVEASYAATVGNAQKAADKERQKRLAEGEKSATSVRSRATGAEFKQAADVLLANFEKHIAGK